MRPSEADATLSARAARFAREATAAPPPLPQRRMAHPGGKIVTTSKDAALRKLLARKAANGEELTADQRRALSSLQDGNGSSAATVQPPRTSAAPAAPPAPAAAPPAPVVALADSNSKRVRTLRKKLRECQQLEERLAEGAVLQANQRDKLAGKGDVQRELTELLG